MQFINKEDLFVQFKSDFVQKEMPDKLLMLLTLIRFRLSMAGELITTIESLANGIGYKPNPREGKINDEIKECLNWVELNNYAFVTDTSIDLLRPKEMFSIQMNQEHTIFVSESTKGKFVQFRFNEFAKIRDYKTQNSKGLLLTMFLNIKKRMNLSDTGNGYAYPSQDRLALECGLSTRGKRTDSLINDLINMGILYCFQAGSYLTKDKKRRNANSLYSIVPIDEKSALLELCTHYRVKGFDKIVKPKKTKKLREDNLDS